MEPDNSWMSSTTFFPLDGEIFWNRSQQELNPTEGSFASRSAELSLCPPKPSAFSWKEHLSDWAVSSSSRPPSRFPRLVRETLSSNKTVLWREVTPTEEEKKRDRSRSPRDKLHRTFPYPRRHDASSSFSASSSVRRLRTSRDQRLSAQLVPTETASFTASLPFRLAEPSNSNVERDQTSIRTEATQRAHCTSAADQTSIGQPPDAIYKPDGRSASRRTKVFAAMNQVETMLAWYLFLHGSSIASISESILLKRDGKVGSRKINPAIALGVQVIEPMFSRYLQRSIARPSVSQIKEDTFRIAEVIIEQYLEYCLIRALDRTDDPDKTGGSRQKAIWRKQATSNGGSGMVSTAAQADAHRVQERQASWGYAQGDVNGLAAFLCEGLRQRLEQPELYITVPPSPPPLSMDQQ